MIGVRVIPLYMSIYLTSRHAYFFEIGCMIPNRISATVLTSAEVNGSMHFVIITSLLMTSGHPFGNLKSVMQQTRDRLGRQSTAYCVAII